MVVIECPHCSEDIEMDDDAFGLFECPYCENDYEWGEAPKSKKRKSISSVNRTQLKKKSRTKSLESKTKPLQRKKQNNSQKNMVVLEYGGIQVSALFATFVMLMLIFTGLNSDEWYTADSWEEYDAEYIRECELSDGAGSGQGWSFGTSAVLTKSVSDTRTDSCWSGGGLDSEEYQRVRYSGQNYGNAIVEVSEQIESKEEYCEEWGGWGDAEDEKEFQDQCEEDLEHLGETHDWYNSWDNGGTLIKIVMLISLFFCLLIFSIKTLLLLQHIGVIESENDLLTKITMYENMLSAIMAMLVVFGLILYWLIIPDFNHLFRLDDNWEEPEEYSYGLGMIWWSLMLFSFIYIVLSVSTMGKSASRD